MPQVFLDGRFVERADARVSAFDAGLQHGVGLFETLQARVSGGEAYVRMLDAHMRRLADSAAALGLSDSLRTIALGDAVVASVEKAGYERARVRLTVTGGDLNLLARARQGVPGAAGGGAGSPSSSAASGSANGTGHDPTILIDVQPATLYPAEMFEAGVGVCIADAKANPFNPFEGHKTLNYWWRLRALQDAASKRVSEAIVLSITNHLVGGCVSNVFLVRGGSLWTPIARGEESAVAVNKDASDAEAAGGDSGGATTGTRGPSGVRGSGGAVLPSPVLPGITRDEILEYADERGLTVQRRMVSITDVLEADEVFLTNSSWGVLPVVRVEAATIAGGRPGQVTRALRERWEHAWAAGEL